MGTNAIPSLLKMIRASDSTVTRRLWDLHLKLRLVAIHSPPAAVLNFRGSSGFEILGEDGKDAVTALTRIFDLNISDTSQLSAAAALGNIGRPAKKAIPTLLRGASNSSGAVRVHALDALSRIHGDPEATAAE